MTSFIEGVKATVDLPAKVSDAVLFLASVKPCKGIADPHLQKFKGPDFYCQQVYDSIEKTLVKTVRSLNCQGFSKTTRGLCAACRRISVILRKRLKCRQKRSSSAALSKKTPLHHYSKKKLCQALKFQRKCNKQLHSRISRINNLLKQESVPVPDHLHTSLLDIMDNQQLSNPMTKMFWEEQRKNLQKQPCGRRYILKMRYFIIVGA